jgi:hypothetical protein
MPLGRLLASEWSRFDGIAFSGAAIPSLFFFLCSFTILAALGLGGGTKSGFLSDTILQLLAIPLLLFSLWKMFDVTWTRQLRQAFWFCAAITLLPVFQLIPLPPWLWTALPNRQVSAEVFEILGRPLSWMPLSVSPQATWLSALSLIPPTAIFLGMLLQGYRERRYLSLLVIGFGLVSVFLGLLQVKQGQESPLRFYAITNPEDSVGFFANRNHLAALLYCTIPLVVAWTLGKTIVESKKKVARISALDTGAIIAGIVGFLALVIIFAGEITARSRAGLLLALVATLSSLALGLSGRHTNKIVLAALAVAVVLSLQFGLIRMLGRASDSLQGARTQIALTTIDAARAYMPFGSGLGTFVPVYGMFEKPADVSLSYINRAHNDVLELWLETGVVGPILMGVFFIWFTRRSIQIWKGSPPVRASKLDRSLARAGTIVVILLIAHSFVDYPLRTAAMMTMMAFACALLIEPPLGAQQEELEITGDVRARSDAERLEYATARPVPTLTKTPKNVQRRSEGGTPDLDAERSQALGAAKSAEELQAALNRIKQVGSSPSFAEPPQPGGSVKARTSPPAAPSGMQAGDVGKREPVIQTAVPAHATPSQKIPDGQEASIPPEHRWGADIEWPKEWSKTERASEDKAD